MMTMTKKIIALAVLLVVFGSAVSGVFASEREDFFSMEGRKFWSAGVNLGSSFATPLIIANVCFTIAPLPNSFFEFGGELGFLNGMAGENIAIGSMEYSSNYIYARANLFFPLGERTFDSYGRSKEAGGMYFGFGLGLMNSEYAYIRSPTEKVVATVKTPTLDGTMGFLIGSGHILFRTGYAIRTTMDFNNLIGVNHRLMLGLTYRIY